MKSYHLEYSDNRLYLHNYIHSISAYASFGLLYLSLYLFIIDSHIVFISILGLFNRALYPKKKIAK